MPALIVIGSQCAIPVDLTKNDASFVIDPGATVQAAVVSADHSERLSDIVTALSSAPGADWANSRVVIEFSALVTGAIVPPVDDGVLDALIEIKVTDGGDPLTWFVTVEIVQGHV